MSAADPALPVRRVPTKNGGAFTIERDGERLAEMTYVRTGEKLAIIDHTWVDDALRGQGAGQRLVEAAVGWARAENLKLLPLCPFAKTVFERTESLRDVLA